MCKSYVGIYAHRNKWGDTPYQDLCTHVYIQYFMDSTGM